MLDLIILTILISLSGALSPGPLTIATISISFKRDWKTGLFSSTGHMLIELPYLILLIFLYYSIINFFENDFFRKSFIIFIVFFIFLFSFFMIKDALYSKINDKINIKIHNPFLVGIIFTGMNPYFLIWWATVGFPIISLVIKYQFPFSFIVMYISHIWLDYAWLTGLSAVTSISKKFIGNKTYKIIIILLASFLIYIAIKFIFNEFLT